MYPISSWYDLLRVAPQGARYFRYRRPTGVRRKFYEGGKAFPLDPEGLCEQRPMHSDGVFNVTFYNEEEAAKPPAEAMPLIIEPPDGDELQVDFSRGFRTGEDPVPVVLRELLNTNKDLAKASTATIDGAIKIIEKISIERDTMAAECEKNRIGPVWQLVLEHHPQIKDLLIALLPTVATWAQTTATSINATSAGVVMAEMKKEQQRIAENEERSLRKVEQVLEHMAALFAQMQEEQKQLRTLITNQKRANSRRKKTI